MNGIRIALSVLNWLLGIYSTIIVVRVVMSFIVMAFPNQTLYKFYQVLHMLTEPVLGPIRNLLGKISFLERLPLDFSPVVAILLISLIQMVLIML